MHVSVSPSSQPFSTHHERTAIHAGRQQLVCAVFSCTICGYLLARFGALQGHLRWCCAVLCACWLTRCSCCLVLWCVVCGVLQSVNFQDNCLTGSLPADAPPGVRQRLGGLLQEIGEPSAAPPPAMWQQVAAAAAAAAAPCSRSSTACSGGCSSSGAGSIHQHLHPPLQKCHSSGMNSCHHIGVSPQLELGNGGW
jgi:hypothetical protein